MKHRNFNGSLVQPADNTTFDHVSHWHNFWTGLSYAGRQGATLSKENTGPYNVTKALPRGQGKVDRSKEKKHQQKCEYSNTLLTIPYDIAA